MQDADNIKFIENLASEAEGLLVFAEKNNIPEFLNKLDSYCAALDLVDVILRTLPPKSDRTISTDVVQNYQAVLEKFAPLHSRLMDLSNKIKATISQDLQNLHRKTAGVKKYLGADKGNEAISITGTRKA